MELLGWVDFGLFVGQEDGHQSLLELLEVMEVELLLVLRLEELQIEKPEAALGFGLELGPLEPGLL